MAPNARRRVGSLQMSAKLWVSGGASLHCNAGDASSSSQVETRGILAPSEKSLETSCLAVLPVRQAPHVTPCRRQTLPFGPPQKRESFARGIRINVWRNNPRRLERSRRRTLQRYRCARRSQREPLAATRALPTVLKSW